MDSDTNGQFEKLMRALQTNTYDDFVKDGDANFLADIRPQMLSGTHAQVAPSMEAGYSAQYLGHLNRGDHVVHLWKLAFENGNGDRLARLSLKLGKVHWFYIQ